MLSSLTELSCDFNVLARLASSSKWGKDLSKSEKEPLHDFTGFSSSKAKAFQNAGYEEWLLLAKLRRSERKGGPNLGLHRQYAMQATQLHAPLEKLFKRAEQITFGCRARVRRLEHQQMPHEN